MSSASDVDFASLYAGFDAAISALDCGKKCAPYNQFGVPFCCDTRHAVPTAYLAEWDYLRVSSTLWHLWEADSAKATGRLRDETPAGQVLIACQGHHFCQREFRSITCRAFPFFPYVTLAGEFIGLSYYWQYEERCWVISNLQAVSCEYRAQFVAAYDSLFQRYPAELATFRYHAGVMRRVFGRRNRAIPLLHRNGAFYKITPRNGRLRRADLEKAPRFGPYAIAALLPFPGEDEIRVG